MKRFWLFLCIAVVALALPACDDDDEDGGGKKKLPSIVNNQYVAQRPLTSLLITSHTGEGDIIKGVPQDDVVEDLKIERNADRTVKAFSSTLMGTYMEIKSQGNTTILTDPSIKEGAGNIEMEFYNGMVTGMAYVNPKTGKKDVALTAAYDAMNRLAQYRMPIIQKHPRTFSYEGNTCVQTNPPLFVYDNATQQNNVDGCDVPLIVLSYFQTEIEIGIFHAMGILGAYTGGKLATGVNNAPIVTEAGVRGMASKMLAAGDEGQIQISYTFDSEGYVTSCILTNMHHSTVTFTFGYEPVVADKEFDELM